MVDKSADRERIAYIDYLSAEIQAATDRIYGTEVDRRRAMEWVAKLSAERRRLAEAAGNVGGERDCPAVPHLENGTTGQSGAEEDGELLMDGAALDRGVEGPSRKPPLNGKSGFTILDSPDAITMNGRGVTELRIMTGDGLLGTQFPSRDLILDPWLPEKGLAGIYGPRGIGKTHITLGCAYAIASKGTFLRWQAPRPRRVLVIDGEMPAVVLQDRYVRIVQAATEAPPDPSHFRLLAMDLQNGGFDLGNEADQRAIESELPDIDVIFVDNISTLARTGRENEAESWLPVQEWALEQRRAGRSVVFVHHAGKGGARSAARADGRMC